MKLINSYSLLFSSIKYFGFILLLFPLLSQSCYAQTSDQEFLKASEKSYSEVLYIKTDRDLYITGEKVWMKIYKLNGLTDTPGNISKIVYIELLDSENNPVNQLKIGIDGYSGSAIFRLSDTLRTGNYIIRSYTNWMQNFSEDFYSYKKISVINPFRINDIKMPVINPDADSIIFSPEGGYLISGIEGRIGFKSINKDGEPVNLRGAVINKQNDTLTHVRTDNGGYGLITIKPADQGNLYLITRDVNNRIKKFQLPAVKGEGILVSVPPKSEKSSALVKIRTSPDFKPADSNLFLVMNTAGLPVIKKELGIKKGSEIRIPGKDMPSGLTHISIVDGPGNLLSSRWVYNETGQAINFNISLPKSRYSSREKIEMVISATDERGNPVESDFSISVAKAVTVSGKNSESDFIQLPGLIQISPDKQRPDINDWLIIYNSFDLSSEPVEKFKNSDPLFLPELEGHLISGNIKIRKSGEPLKNENISLSFVGKKALCQFAKTNSNGEFHFRTSENGTKEVVIQPLSEKITDYYVELNNPFTPATKKYSYAPFLPDTGKLADINNVIISTQINNIYEPYTQPSGKSPVDLEKRNFYGKPDNTILLSNYIELTSLKEVVKEIIPDVSTVKKNDKINFKLYYQYQSQPYENNPLVLVDGVPVYDLEKVILINSRDLEKIDVFTTRYYISDIILDGILHFVTKTGKLDVIDLDRSAYRVEYDLPENHKEFYSPDYSDDKLLNDRIPDFRNTLYWNPDMHTSKTGKAAVEFYSSDESAEYVITIEGITSDGKTGSVSMPLIIKGR